ncbi:MAG: sigma-54-dependent Fis family transcriptional regulator, partial [Calditrichaeota bacterium]|nr:sigma-54-dependent Fis family transcriptional regulator [Calditrichota bacterium]
GNVRELENAIQRAALLTRQSQISLQDLPDEIHPDSPQQKKPLSLEELEKRQIDYVLSIT